MKLAAAGRILLWNGGSLWIGRSGPPTDLHSHHAVQIGLALSDDSLRFRSDEGDWSPYRTALIAAHHSHALDGHDKLVAMVFAEPESREGRALQQRCLKDGILAIADGTLDLQRAALCDGYNESAPDSALTASARSVISRLAATTETPGATMDPRIKRALELIRARIGETILLAAYTANKSLTDASHAGGFADSAHFSRTFRSMFGISPSSIQID